MINGLKIYCLIGISKKEFNIPQNWSIRCYGTSKGRLYTISSNLTSIFGGNFITEEKLKAKVQQYYRKEKMNQISNV